MFLFFPSRNGGIFLCLTGLSEIYFPIEKSFSLSKAMMVTIARELGNATDTSYLPTAMKPAYALASELGNRTDQSILPTGTNPAYALASELGNLTDPLNLPQGTNPAYALASAVGRCDDRHNLKAIQSRQNL